MKFLNLNRGTLALTDISVSPDGEWIVCRSYGRKEDIYVVKADGSGLRRLTGAPPRSFGHMSHPFSGAVVLAISAVVAPSTSLGP